MTDTKHIMAFFGLTATEAVREAKTLTKEDRAQLGEGIRNGSFTY